jgi:small conductance mechanosensitive channel
VGVFVWTVGVLVASSIVFPGVTPANLLALLGLGSVAIGFAFKDIFENFLAGILIMLRKKVNIGDVIECETVEGRVEQITLRDTYLRHLSNELVLVPNAYLFKNPLKILTDASLRRYTVDVGVTYSADLDRAAEVLPSQSKCSLRCSETMQSISWCDGGPVLHRFRVIPAGTMSCGR